MVPPKPDPSRKGDCVEFPPSFSEGFTKGCFWFFVFWIFLSTLFFIALSVNSIRSTVNSIEDDVSAIEYTLKKEKRK